MSNLIKKFKDDQGKEIQLEFIQDGDTVLIFLGEDEVTHSVKRMLGKPYMRHVAFELTNSPRIKDEDYYYDNFRDQQLLEASQ